MKHEGESLGAGGGSWDRVRPSAANFGVLGGFPSCMPPPDPPKFSPWGSARRTRCRSSASGGPRLEASPCTPRPLSLPEFLLISPKTAQTTSRRGHSGTRHPIVGGGQPEEFGETKASLACPSAPTDLRPPGPCRHRPVAPAPLAWPRCSWGLSGFPSRDRVPAGRGRSVGC